MTDEITLDAPETRLERFLAAAAGVEGITLDEPETRIERYLYKIAQGSGGVPAVEDADKGKFLHANESTGDLEWATAGGSGGGVLVVTDTDGTLDKTWQEIKDAILSGGVVIDDGTNALCAIAAIFDSRGSQYKVSSCALGGTLVRAYVTDSASGYPVLQ